MSCLEGLYPETFNPSLGPGVVVDTQGLVELCECSDQGSDHHRVLSEVHWAKDCAAENLTGSEWSSGSPGRRKAEGGRRKAKRSTRVLKVFCGEAGFGKG